MLTEALDKSFGSVKKMEKIRIPISLYVFGFQNILTYKTILTVLLIVLFFESKKLATDIILSISNIAS